MHAKKTNKTKLAVVLLAVVLLIGCTAGATLAWLMDSTEEVVNTFTTSDIDIELTETTGAEYKMIPGATIEKDPVVTVKANSEACWLFVKVEASAGVVLENAEGKYAATDYVTYAIITGTDGWTLVPGETNVYYREVDAATAKNGETYKILVNDQVKVLDTVTKAMMNAFDANNDGVIDDNEKKALPTLTFTAYAVQKEAATTAPAAWELAKAL